MFPYSGIDVLLTFEGAKLANFKATRQTDLPVYTALMIGSFSGTVSALSVYHMNLVRTACRPVAPLLIRLSTRAFWTLFFSTDLPPRGRARLLPWVGTHIGRGHSYCVHIVYHL